MTQEELYALACMAVDVAAGEGRLETGSYGTVDERQEVLAWLHEVTARLQCKHDHLVCGIAQHEEHPPPPPRTYEALVCCSDCGTYFRNAREMRDAGIFERAEAMRRAAVDAITTVPPRPFIVVSTYPDRTVLRCDAHGLETGEPVNVLADGHELPMGLTEGEIYWAIVLGPDRLQLAHSLRDVVDGVAIFLTTPGTGVLRRLSSGPNMASERGSITGERA